MELAASRHTNFVGEMETALCLLLIFTLLYSNDITNLKVQACHPVPVVQNWHQTSALTPPARSAIDEK